MQVAALEPVHKGQKNQSLDRPPVEECPLKSFDARALFKRDALNGGFCYLFRLSTFTIIHTLLPVSVTSSVSSVQQVTTHQTAFCFPDSVCPHGTREWAQGEMGAYWVRLCTCSCRGQRTVSSACQGFVADLPCDPGSRTGLFWVCASRP